MESADLVAATNSRGTASFAVLRVMAAGAARTDGHTVRLRHLGIAPGAFVSISLVAQAACDAGRYTWTVVAAGFTQHLTTAVDGECGLQFIRQPADTEVGASITDAPLQLGDPIQVAVESEHGQRVTEDNEAVTLGIANVPPGGTSTLDGTTTVEPVDGIATFCDPNQIPDCELPSIAAHGQGYTLSATTGEVNGEEQAISDPFNIVDDGKVCTDAGLCTVQTRFDDTGARIGILAQPGDRLDVSIGVDQLTCEGYTNTSQVVTYDTVTDSDALGSLSFEKEPSGRRITGYYVCFSSSVGFVDRYHHYVPPGGSGILPDCAVVQVSPCMVSRHFDPGSGYVTLAFRSPAGDPKVVG
jgi:hypothetical protein